MFVTLPNASTCNTDGYWSLLPTLPSSTFLIIADVKFCSTANIVLSTAGIKEDNAHLIPVSVCIPGSGGSLRACSAVTGFRIGFRTAVFLH